MDDIVHEYNICTTVSMKCGDHNLAIEHARRRGRPRDFLKRKAILDAAGALFLDRGIPTTSMEAVAERAGVSKMTLYSHFPDKSALLAAVFERTLKETVLPELAEDEVPAAERLSEFGERLVGYLTQPEIVRTASMMAANAAEFPELAAAFYAAGPAAVLARVAHYLEAVEKREGLHLPAPALAAEQLVAAWLGVDQLRESLGVSGPPSAETISRRVRFATQALLRGWKAEGAPAAPS
jgi:TetR/AcrR family transcriptional regulator, mexJK operon transcriptional repressor